MVTTHLIILLLNVLQGITGTFASVLTIRRPLKANLPPTHELQHLDNENAPEARSAVGGCTSFRRCIWS